MRSDDKKFCPYCGSANVHYVGVDDGLGDYGTSVCDVYECEDCDQRFEENCMDDADALWEMGYDADGTDLEDIDYPPTDEKPFTLGRL